MRIIGVFLNPEIRTGGHKRYLELCQSFANTGHEVFLILNENIKTLFNGINEIRIQYDYSKQLIPYSLVTYLKINQNLNVIIDQIKTCDYIVVFGETHLFAGIYLEKVFSAKLLFSLRSNGVVEAQLKRHEPSVNIIKKIRFILSEGKYRHYERLFGKKVIW
jgi:hypothetical protein